MEHWTEDRELLELYVLGQVSEEEKLKLKQHVETCAVCREAVEREADFVRKVRAYGREQLRIRLKEKIGEASGPAKIPWPHIASAAAVLVLVVGLGMYNRWWDFSEVAQPEEGIPSVLKNEGEKTAATEEKDLPGQETGAADARMGAGAPEKPAAALPSAVAKSEDEAQGKISKRDDRSEIPAKERPADALQVSEMESFREQVYWLDGVVTEVAEEARDAAGIRRAEKERNEQADAALRSQIQSSKSKGSYILRQQPLAALPREQQLQKKVSARTKVELTRDGAVLTIFSDDIDLRQKTLQAEPIAGDSLVFSVDGKMLIYKLPGAALKQQQ